MAGEGTAIAKAYVQIVPSAKGISGGISKALGGQEEADKAGKSLAGSVVSAIGGAIAAAGVGKMLAKSISEGAALEQSIGGIETLFKGSAETVIKNAQQAYKTAGLSANAYMESVTGFSASLLQGLGGDTEKAAEVADMAMRDMSDNANKMGSDMESIKTAYQGFAKQNYTMLDNLKLGYGGTKSEMERLLADAEKFSGKKYDIGNLGDVYDAIHAIQEKLEITDATADEAEKTISGSFAAMKASAQNVMGYLATGMDVKPAMQQLVEASSTFLFNNLLPAVGRVFMQLPTVIGTIVNEVGGQAAVDMINGLSAGMAERIQNFAETALPMLEGFSAGLRENAGKLVDAGLNLIEQIANGIIASIPVIISTVPTIIQNFAGIINDNGPKILKTGGNILKNLAKGIIKNIPVVVENFPKIISAIVSVWQAFNWLDLGKKVVDLIKAGLKALPTIGREIAKTGVEAIKNGFKIDWASIGKNIIDGIAKGLRNAVSALTSAAKTAAQSAFEAAKDKLGIHSPSTLFRDKVGKNISLGMAEGIERNQEPVRRAVQVASDNAMQVHLSAAQYTPTQLGGMDKDVKELLMQYLPYLADKNVAVWLEDAANRLSGPINRKLGQQAALEGRGW